jgi:hypothetical protein
MAVYESHYKELKFYVNGNLKAFNGGRYVAATQDEIAVLDKLADTRKVEADTPAKPAEEKAKEPAPKPKRKAPAKSSAK